MSHHHGSQHRQPKRCVRDPLRAGNLRHVQAFGRKERDNPHTDQTDKTGHHNQTGLQTGHQRNGIKRLHFHMEREMGTAQNKNSKYGNIVALVLRTDYRQSHAHRAIPEKDRAEYAACRRTPAGNKHTQTRKQPKCGQTCQRLTACRRLASPSCHGRQQECNDNQSGVAPNHFMGMPIQTRQFRRTLIAEAPKQYRQCAIQSRQRVKRAEGHCPYRMFEQIVHGGSFNFYIIIRQQQRPSETFQTAIDSLPYYTFSGKGKKGSIAGKSSRSSKRA